MPVGEAQDLLHVGVDPLQHLVVAHDPDEGDPTGAGGAVVAAVDQVADVGELVGDSCCAGKEDYVPVRVEAVVAGVGAFKGCSEGEGSQGGGTGGVVELAGEACVGAYDEADGGGGGGCSRGVFS